MERGRFSAFAEAVRSHDPEKGSLQGFAEAAIRRRLADQFRKNRAGGQEISVDPSVFEADPSEEEDGLALRMAASKKTAVAEDRSLKEEIEGGERNVCRLWILVF